jgi:hypothetical protein
MPQSASIGYMMPTPSAVVIAAKQWLNYPRVLVQLQLLHVHIDQQIVHKCYL